MSKRIMTLVFGISMVLSSICIGKASAITLPEPGTFFPGTFVPTSVQYGDFYSYSLPLLAYFYGSQYDVASAPGQIADDIVIATGINGGPSTTNIAGVEDAYETPNSNGIPTFSTQASPDPGQVGPAFSGQQTGTWDAQTSALRTYLSTTGSDLVFFFNNNQENSGAAVNQNLFAWAQVELVDLQGGAPNLYFDFTNTNTGQNVLAYNSPGAADGTVFDGSFPLQSDFVLSGGQLRLGSDGNIYFAGQALPAGVSVVETFNHNLGANQAAYAVFSPELNAILLNPLSPYDVLRGDFRMYALNNGYEQLFIRLADVGGELPPPVIPEPATMLLLGTGLLGLAGFKLRGKK